jgi:hypothetical protein
LRFAAITLVVVFTSAIAGLAAGSGNSIRSQAHASSRLPEQAAPAGKGQADPASQAITAAAVNGVVNPVFYPGADIGEKINNVFAAGNSTT